MKMSIDIETYSEIDLAKSGVYAYAADPSFEILLCSYAFDGGDVRTIEGEQGIREDKAFLKALHDPSVEKRAWNANFERVCLGRALGERLDPSEWSCSMVLAQYLGLPASLATAGSVLRVEQKTEGINLIRYFSKPCKPTKANKGRTRNLPEHAPDKWQAFKAYNAQDVRAEMAIRKKLDAFQLPDEEKTIYNLDQKINDLGVRLDRVLIDQAIRFDETFTAEKKDEAKALTGLANPNSVSQLKAWIETVENTEIASLNKKTLKQIKAKDPRVKRVLELRSQLAKTSVAKYSAMARAVNPDGRARGLLQYYGANRTGRWAGRLIQVQNLPQNKLRELDDARELLRSGDFESIRLIYENPSEVLSQLIRTAFIPSDGCRFIVADFAAIEARVIAWLAGEAWRQQVFKDGGDIYCASASKMFGVKVEKHGINGHLRQKGKIAELALGYGGSVGALRQMGALAMGLQEEELPALVDQWRVSNTNITKLWKELEHTALVAVKNKIVTRSKKGVAFQVARGMLFITLPSGRRLAYAKPSIGINRFDRECLLYRDTDQATRKWGEVETYGGKLAENITQAIARDCLAEAMLRLDRAGYDIVMHVHDEVVLDVPNTRKNALEEASAIMGAPIDWAPGLVLRADGYECSYYRKD